MSPTRPLILGMDGGGTTTTTWIAEAGGGVIGRGKSGASNMKAVGPVVARTALDLSVFAAFRDAGLELGPIDAACLGLAGFDRPEDRAWLESWAAESAWARRLVLVNDGDLVVTAGTPGGWGVGLIAGTGSIAVGISPDGRKARAGGWGFVLGDEGSAFAIAVAALKRIARTADGRNEPAVSDDPLTRHICQALGIDGPRGLVTAVYGPGFERSRIARLAPAVVAASTEDPAVVRTILDPAAFELAEMVMAVARTLGWPEGPLPLAMAGGFLLNCEPICRVLVDCLTSSGYEVEVSRVPNPVEGALILARRALES